MSTIRAFPVAEGTLHDLRAHLQAAANLELWTLPLYLTALSSIRADSSSISLPVRGTSTVTRLVVSVALQEMFHLQLAGNLCRLFGEVPRLDWPTYDGKIPYVTTLPKGVEVRLGTAADPNTLALMLAVETGVDIPKPVSPEDPAVPAYPFIQYQDGQPAYPSIGTLYSVTVQLIDRFRERADPGAPQVANGLFSTWYGHTGLIQPATLDDAVNIIVEQGEGALGRPAAPIVDPDAIPDPRGFRDPFRTENRYSHWERFDLAVKNAGAGLDCWPTSDDTPCPEQLNLSSALAALLEGLRAGWRGDRPDLSAMFLLRPALAKVFAAGQLPNFAPSARPVTTAGPAIAPPAPTWSADVQYYFTLTDIEGMKVNHVQAPDLGQQASVAAAQTTIAEVVRNGQMPPGELNRWPDVLLQSFRGWGGN